MSQEVRNADASSKRFSLKNLYLDPNNYRLIHETDQVEVGDAQVKDRVVAQRTFRLLVGDRNQHIQDLLTVLKPMVISLLIRYRYGNCPVVDMS